MTHAAPRAALIGAGALFVLLKAYALHPVVGDENIYFYAAWRSAQGMFPWRDFVFAHPPLHIHLLTILSLVSGGAFLILKAAPAVCILIAGLLTHAAIRRLDDGDLLPGRGWPLLAVVLFWFCYDTLRMSSHPTGANQATLLVCLGLAAWSGIGGRHRDLICGAAFGGALATAHYVLPLIAALLVVAIARPDRGSAGRLRAVILNAAGSFALIHLPAWTLAPGAWWEQAVVFHMRKPPIGSTFTAAFRGLMSAEGFLVAASAMLALLALRERPRAALAWLPAAGLAYLGFFSFFDRVYVYYFLPAIPFLAIGGAMIVRRAVTLVRTRQPAHGVVLILLPLLVQPFAYRTTPDVAEDPAEVREYTFRPTGVIGPANRVLEWIFPRRRVIGIPVPGVIRYLWHESDFWEEAPLLARRVAELLPADATIYGDSTTAPLIAFLAGRRLSCDLADTNTMHFRAGLRAVEDDLACARADRLVLVVEQPGRGLALLPEFQRFLRDETTPWDVARAGSARVRLHLWRGAAPSAGGTPPLE